MNNLYSYSQDRSLHIKAFGLFVLMALLFISNMLHAEGSKELAANGGSRAYLLSSANGGNKSFPFPTLGTMKVYVKAGETIYVGSSAQGINSGTINLRAPDGTTYTSGTSTTVGLIANRAQEVAGPQPNAGGYQPFTQVAAAGQEGVWEIDFISPSNGVDQPSNPAPIAASDNWVQPYGPYIAAFDISVRNASNSGFLTGRVFTNIFSGILGNFTVGFNGILHVLTKDGYQYTFDNNGQAGNGFSFFVNNKGFKADNGAPSYKSVNTTTNPNVADPRVADTESDITHKIFFNTPDTGLPVSANAPGGVTTWLLALPAEPSISDFKFIGKEGTVGQSGAALGGNFSFESTANGIYSIIIDADRNGVYTDAADRTLTGTVNAGITKVNWDGLDGTGKKVPANITIYNTKISVSLYRAEVHFPFFDVERNINGTRLTRVNGANAPDNNMYWDDSAITPIGTPSNPLKNLTGVNSFVNGHTWGSPAPDPSNEDDFGNNVGIDTWAYVTSNPLVAATSFKVSQADLEVVNITSTSVCAGQPIHYTVDVKNNGPDDVTGALFTFSIPQNLTAISVSSNSVTDSSLVTNQNTTANLYTATLNLNNGAIRRILITGTVGTMPSGGVLTVTAGIVRPPDVTDPDATNAADNTSPVDAQIECSGSHSESGCNNIKTNTVTLFAAPDAGSDQTVMQNTIATLNGNTNGTWSPGIGNPAVATIASPANFTTTVSGLTALGKYSFVFTNANGCTDTLAVTVVSSTMSIPDIITPNGDGKNDVFQVKGLNFYPGSQLLIFNRWGNEVYRSDNYQNNWGGSGLADGTYYYVLNRKETSGGINTFKGWVYLKR